MKKPLPPLPQWAKHLKPNSRVVSKEISELFGIHNDYVSKFMRLRMISFETMRSYAKPRRHYLWSDVLEVYNNEIKETEK